jgi:hypothetical protein
MTEILLIFSMREGCFQQTTIIPVMRLFCLEYFVYVCVFFEKNPHCHRLNEIYD